MDAMKCVIRVGLGCLLFVGAMQSVNAQAVQLPTIQNFGMSTTVVVPDRGRTYAGGVSRSARSTSRRGSPFLPSSRGYGAETTASGVSVGAYIHDFEEMDRTLLEQAARNRDDRFGSSRTSSVAANPQSIRSQLDHRLPRVSDVRRRVTAMRAEKLAQAKTEIKIGLRREKAGDIAGAQAKYRQAMKYATPELQTKLTAHIKKLALQLR